MKIFPNVPLNISVPIFRIEEAVGAFRKPLSYVWIGWWVICGRCSCNWLNGRPEPYPIRELQLANEQRLREIFLRGTRCIIDDKNASIISALNMVS
jgi:hypothetical protein